MAVSAVEMGLGSVVLGATDVFWVIGDMSSWTFNYRSIVLVGLLIGLILVLHGFVYLARAVYVYIATHDKKINDKRNTKRRISKQAQVIMHLNTRLDRLEAKNDV